MLNHLKGYECAFRNDIEDVAEMLKRKHSGHYCIWNLSERSYDYQKFDSMVCLSLIHI